MHQRQHLHAIVFGKVQGVFFRATTLKYAKLYGIVGTVENKNDGSVEIFASGNKELLDSFIKAIQENPGKGKIENIEIKFFENLIIYNDFKILN